MVQKPKKKASARRKVAAKRDAPGKPKSDYNLWRFLIVFVEGVFELINNNKIYPAFAFLLLGIIGLIVWRLPETELAEILKLLINEFILGKGGLIFLLVATNLGWAYLFKRMRRIYGDEIDRLAKIRSDLMHQTDRRAIENHRSSTDECEESYVMPKAESAMKTATSTTKAKGSET